MTASRNFDTNRVEMPSHCFSGRLFQTGHPGAAAAAHRAIGGVGESANESTTLKVRRDRRGGAAGSPQ